VSKLIACGPCGANPASLTYGPTATGVAGTNNPAFCYQIIVTNCSDNVTLTNVQISDPTLGLTFTLPTNLPPHTATAPIFTGASFGVGTVTNTVTATGNSQATGETVTSNAKAVAIVVPASVTCSLDLSSSVNQNTNNSPPCEVTLPANSVNSPVTVKLAINNTGQADLNVSIIGGNILTSGLVNCTGGAAVTFGTVFVPAGGTTNFVVGCVSVSCPGTNISAVVQGTAVASKTVPCVLDVSGNAITTAPSSCSQCVNCLVAPPCIQVSKLIACGPCGSSPAGLSYGPTATAVAGTNNPAFCYQIVVTNCGGITLTNVRISDPTLGLTITLPTNLPPGTATAPIFHGASYPVGTVTNTVTATGQSQATGQSTSSQASAVAIVVPARVTCSVSLSSSLNVNSNGSGGCSVTLPAGTVNAPIMVTITINNTGQADLNVNIVGGNILTSSVFDCNFLTNVVFGTVFVPAGQTVVTNIGCVNVSCPGGTISVQVQGTAVASASIPCVLDTFGNVIKTAVSSCQDCVNCETGAGCTPGFWKNCTQQWANSGFSTGQSVSSVFTLPSCVENVGSATLLEALSFQGGSGVNGAAHILLRAAVAGLLNSVKVNYPLSTAQVISQVNAALASCERPAILTLASTLDGLNNLGCRDSNGNGLPCHATSPLPTP
jgi:hypothetical protein